MINRFCWFVESTWWRFIRWIEGPWRICYNCLECIEDYYVPDDPYFFCRFRDIEVDPNDKGCRAFRGWKKHGG